MSVLHLDLIGDTLVLLSFLRRFLVVLLTEGSQVVLMTDLLFFEAYGQRALIRFELTFLDTVLVFHILKRYLSLLFQFSQLVQVLEQQVLHTLLVHLDLDLMFF